MKCPKCQSEYQVGDKFCRECGTKLPSICPQCRHEVSPKDKFCPECGTDLVKTQKVDQKVTAPSLEDLYTRLQRSMPQSLAEKIQTAIATEGENRILSILFADVTNSVAITENMPPEDSADLISECLKSMTDPILRHGGFINRYLGDSVLAFFGIPETHENDPERAILSALEMRDAVTKLNLSIKISINTGMVFVGAIGPDSHSEFTAMGTAVNLSARLKDIAEPGQILVGETTYRSTRRSFEFQPLPLLTIKGISEPIHAYEVIKPLPKPEKIRGIEGIGSEMIGRDKEFSELKECVDELLAGKGQIVSIIGEAGVGKTRLVSELKEYLRQKIKDKKGSSIFHPYLEGRGVSIGESVGYWVFIDILRSYLEFSEQDSLDDRKKKIIDRMQSLFPQRWEEIVPYIGNLLSVRFDNEWDEKIKYLPPEQVKYQTFLTLRDIFLILAQQNPLLLIFEDLHWADNLSLDMINLLMDILTISPLMILCIYRPEKEHKSWHIGTRASGKCLERYREITLRALNPHESRMLIESLLTIENLPESVKQTVTNKAGGNPFFVEEVIRSLIERGVVYQDGDRWIAKEDINDVEVPDTIQSVIMARIDRLEEEVKYVLQSASVIGRLFRYNLLRYITQQEGNLDGYLWQLEERDLVYEEHAIPELEYSFKHVLTQETAYNTILSRRRREFHRKVAEGYEALYSSRIEECYEELAYHYSRSDDKDKALDYLVKAGDKSKKVYANESAIEYYNQALKLAEVSESKSVDVLGHIYQSLGEIYFPMARHKEALEYCHKALEYITNGKLRSRIYAIMGWACEREARYDQGLEYLNAGVTELGEDTNSVEMARICIPMSWIKGDQGKLEEGIKIAKNGLKVVEGTDSIPEIQDLLIFLALVVCLSGDTDKAFEYARKSVEVAEKSGNSYFIANTTLHLGWVYWYAGEDDVSIRLMEKALEIFKKLDYQFFIGQACSYIGRVYYGRNDWDMVIIYFEEFLKMPNHPWFIVHLYLLGFVYLLKGNTEKAIEYSKKALECIGLPNSSKVHNSVFFGILYTLEEAYILVKRWDDFISYWEAIKKEKADFIQEFGSVKWYLESRELSGHFIEPSFIDEFAEPGLKPEWKWEDQGGKASYNFSSKAGWLEIRTASPRTFSGLGRKFITSGNTSMLLQEISGDFAVETKMTLAADNLPSVGGFVVRKDGEYQVQLEMKMEGIHNISLVGNMRGIYNVFGIGVLVSDVVYLRFERIGDKFIAYCSDDERKWMTCGEFSFPVEDPIQVGLYTVGVAGVFGPTNTDFVTHFDCFRIFR
ncbi:MAG: tetratricopeptide repeat protein [Candidatus Saganbacteria bacterium]|nr:tetratricopeptide repeat protein [Candidatus Saganbacteria bacterium]